MSPTDSELLPAGLAAVLMDLPTDATPLMILQQLAEYWHANTFAHHSASELELLAQAVATLRAAGVEVQAEPRGWKGHGDIVVNMDRRDAPQWLTREGRGLLANATLWENSMSFREALDRLVACATRSAHQAALIVFVRQGGLAKVMQSARYVCEKHPAFGNFGKAVSDNQLKLWLSISKNPDKVVLATLLFCDLFEGVHRGGADEPDELGSWELGFEP